MNCECIYSGLKKVVPQEIPFSTSAEVSSNLTWYEAIKLKQWRPLIDQRKHSLLDVALFLHQHQIPADTSSLACTLKREAVWKAITEYVHMYAYYRKESYSVTRHTSIQRLKNHSHKQIKCFLLLCLAKVIYFFLYKKKKKKSLCYAVLKVHDFI